jgi:starch-binding outer membrane protein, SusD/RagB family
MKIKNYIAILILSTGLLACNELLIESPKSSFYPGNIFPEENGVVAAVAGVYDAAKRHTYGISSSNSQLSDIILIGTDVGTTKWTGSHRNAFDGYTYSVEEDNIFSMWENCYKAISRANVLLEGITNSELDAEVINRAKAEAMFIRAFTYFKMVQLWGPVPLSLSGSFESELNRAPLKDVYNQIISDLTTALEPGALPESSEIEPARITVYAAHTLLAKVYMTIASYKKYGTKVESLITGNGKADYGYAAIDISLDDLYDLALEQIDLVMSSGKFSLMQNYNDVFNIANKNTNPETIWEMQFALFSDGGSRWSKEWGIQAWPPGGVRGRIRSWQGLAGCKPNPVFYEYYQNGDMRREWNFPQYRIITDNKNDFEIIGFSTYDPRRMYKTTENGEELPGFFFNTAGMGKYRWSEEWNGLHAGINDETNTNGIVYRYADVLLMYAECLIEKNNNTATQEAVDAVNEIRNRARRSIDPVVSPGQLFDNLGYSIENPIGNSNGSEDPSLTPDFPNADISTLDMAEIMKERACELCFEHHRKYDLLRWGKLQEFLAQRLPNGYRFFVGGTDLENLADYKLLWPIPQNEIDAINNKEFLYQNPGW